MASTIHDLRLELDRLRLRRWWARWAAVSANCLAVVLAVLMAGLALDVAFKPPPLERSIVLIAMLIVIAAACWSLVRPHVGRGESVVTLALAAERRLGLSNDLVAALEFDDPFRRQHGSASLRGAVIEYVSEAAADLDIGDDAGGRQVRLALRTFIIPVWLWAAVAVVSPAYVAAYGQRLMLSPAAYPTQTTIESIDSPGEVVTAGRRVPFVVRIGGEPPANAQVRLQADDGESSVIDLVPDIDDPGVFRGELAVADGDMTYTVMAGDAVSEPRRLTVRVPPEVRLELRPQPRPPTAGPWLPARPRMSFTTGATVEARVAIRPAGTAEAVRAVTPAGSFAMLPTTQQGIWRLDPTGTPLDPLGADTPLRIDITTVDGDEIDGVVGTQIIASPDRPPRVTVETNGRSVLPGAEPVVSYRIEDDRGLQAVWAELAVRQPGASPYTVRIPLEQPGGRASIRGVWTLSLTEADLVPGASVEVTVLASDTSPTREKPGRSVPILLSVVDEAGLYASMAPTERRIEDMISRIIDEQTRIGGTP